MTTVADSARTISGVWSAMPGWGIAGDLTPTELVEARQIKTLRKIIGVCLIAVVALCVAGYFYASHQVSTAQGAQQDVNDTTLIEQAQLAKYSRITQMEDRVTVIRGQVESLMSTDVNLDRLYGELDDALPPTMSITSVVITIDAAGTGVVSDSGINLSGHAVVGNLTLTGTGAKLTDLATFVDNLNREKGLVDVLPGTNTASGGQTTVGLSASLTDQLYTHHYDVTGGN